VVGRVCVGLYKSVEGVPGKVGIRAAAAAPVSGVHSWLCTCSAGASKLYEGDTLRGVLLQRCTSEQAAHVVCCTAQRVGVSGTGVWAR